MAGDNMILALGGGAGRRPCLDRLEEASRPKTPRAPVLDASERLTQQPQLQDWTRYMTSSPNWADPRP